MMMKREYRGQRSVAAIADFIRQQQVDPVKEIHSMEEINTLDVSGKHTLSVKTLNTHTVIILVSTLSFSYYSTEEQEEHHRLL